MFAIAALITFQLRHRFGIVATAGPSSPAFRGGELVTRKRETVLRPPSWALMSFSHFADLSFCGRPLGL